MSNELTDTWPDMTLKQRDIYRIIDRADEPISSQTVADRSDRFSYWAAHNGCKALYDRDMLDRDYGENGKYLWSVKT